MAKILMISPHLDDAVLSYGGHLAQLKNAGDEMLVYTVFAGSPEPPYSPVAEGFHAQWDLTGDPVAPRREEDDNALSTLGVAGLHGPYLDSIYRRGSRGGWLIEDQDPMDHHGDDEDGLVAAVAATIEDLITEHDVDRVMTCAAIGNHVDHRRARDATVMAVGRTGTPLALWDDFPYVAWPECADFELPPELKASAAVAGPVSADVWETKNRAIGCYASQLAMLESDGDSVRDMLAEHCDSQRSRYGVEGFYEVFRHVTS